MPTPELTRGAMARIMNGDEIDSPVLQVLGVKCIQGETLRVRVVLSDGQHFNTYVILASQLHPLYHEDKISENTIIRLNKYITSMVNRSDSGKRVLILLDITVLVPGNQTEKIGDPISYAEVSVSGNSGNTANTNNNTSGQPQQSSRSATSLSASTSSYLNKNNNSNSTNVKSNKSHNISETNQSVNGGITYPIASLSPYQNKWVIKARVTSKSAIRTWSNAKGEGKLFSITLMDESGEIKATAFREQCDKFYDLLQVDQVYFISKCQLKPANKQFSTLNNDYEMTFTNETMIEPCNEISDIPEVKYNFISISDVANMEDKAVVDVIGVCKEVGEIQQFTARTNNRLMKKRELVLVDTSNAAVSLTLWGDEAENFDGYVQPVIAVKGARINEFNGGKSLSVGQNSAMRINPDIAEGHKLRGWFDNGGGENITNSVSARSGAGGNFNTEWRTFYEARNLGTGDRADYFQTKAVVHLLKSQNAFYKACPQPECNKKVIDEDNGHYRCEKCNAVFMEFKYRLLINMNIGDWTSNRWVTCFSDLAEQLLGHPAKEIGEALENDPSKAEEIFTSINFHSYIFKLRSKVETFGDTTRNKLVAQSAAPINYKEYNKYLINNLKELTGISKN